MIKRIGPLVVVLVVARRRALAPAVALAALDRHPGIVEDVAREEITAMSDIQQRLATGKGKFTPLYPELGTEPVSYEDSISPEFFAAEREAVFKRTWLNVGRIERLPRPGSYFTRELPGDWLRSSSRATSKARSMPSTTSAPTAATRSCGRSTRKRRRAATVASSPASTTAGATASTGGSSTSPTSRSSSTSTRTRCACRRCTATFSPGSSSSTSRRTRSRCAPSSASGSSSSRRTRSIS